MAAVDLISIALRRMHQTGDFDVSMEFGRRFIHGDPLYRGGLHFPYLPAAAMFFSAFSLMPKPLAFVILYSLAIISLWLIMWMLAAMVCETEPALRERVWPVSIATLILASHYILRDLDDGGPNIILLALAMGGVYLAWVRREVAAAGCLGAATALKATAGIFIPFLLWKRCWRLAAYSAAAVAFWLALPALWMGPSSWWIHQREWIRSAAGFAVGLNACRRSLLWRSKHQESGAKARDRAPCASRARGDSRLPARIVAATLALVLVGIFGWLTRRPYGERLDLTWLTETSGLLILAALLAPIAWVQHLVLAIPAIYLIAADWFGKRNFGVVAKIGDGALHHPGAAAEPDDIGKGPVSHVARLSCSHHLHAAAFGGADDALSRIISGAWLTMNGRSYSRCGMPSGAVKLPRTTSRDKLLRGGASCQALVSADPSCCWSVSRPH